MNKKKKVLVFGTFDRLHPGHLYFLKQAKKLGDILFVVVARDKNVEKIKGRKPQESEKERQKAIVKSGYATKVLLGAKDLRKKYKIISKINPDIIALGYDQKFFLKNLPNILKKLKKPCRLVRLKAYQPKRYKSSILRRK